MSKLTKKELTEIANEHELRLFQIEKALEQHGINWFSDEPKLKQLDQSVFNGLDEKWRFAAVDKNGKAYFLEPDERGLFVSFGYWIGFSADKLIGTGYDTSNWQNSLIERDKVELTGSDLCRKMLERGDKYVMCIVSKYKNRIDLESVILPQTVVKFNEYCFITTISKWKYAIPINNQGEPLTAKDVGL